MRTTVALGVCAVLLLQIRKSKSACCSSLTVAQRALCHILTDYTCVGSAICAAPAPSTSQQQSLSSYLAAQDNLQIYSSALEMTGTAGERVATW